MESVATVETRCKASALPPRLGSLRLPHFPQPRRRIYLQTINPGGGSFLLDRGGLFLRCQSEVGHRVAGGRTAGGLPGAAATVYSHRLVFVARDGRPAAVVALSTDDHAPEPAELCARTR